MIRQPRRVRQANVTPSKKLQATTTPEDHKKTIPLKIGGLNFGPRQQAIYLNQLAGPNGYQHQRGIKSGIKRRMERAIDINDIDTTNA